MTEPDDLFEFGDLDDTDSLEIDLDELFGDLEMLAIDIDAIEAGGAAAPATAAPVQPAAAPVVAAPAPAAAAPAAAAPAAAPAAAAPAPAAPAPAAPTPAAPAPVAAAPAPVAAAPAPIPQAQPVAAQAPAPQPVYQNQVIQPVAPAPQVFAQPAPPADGSLLSKFRLTKTSAAIGFATIITLANVAVTMIKPVNTTNPALQAGANTQLASGTTTATYDDTEVQTEIEALHAEIAMLRSQGSPTKPIPASYTKGGHPAFDDASKNLQEGNYIAARQRLYALLAIVDRFDTYERDAIEATASYMLADSWRMEAENPTTQGAE